MGNSELEEEAFVDDSGDYVIYEGDGSEVASSSMNDEEEDVISQTTSREDVSMEGEDTLEQQFEEQQVELDSAAFTTSLATDSLCCIAIHPAFPNTPHVAMGGCDDTCRIYKYSQQFGCLDSDQSCDELPSATQTPLTVLAVLQDATDTIGSISYSSDGLYLATGCLDATVRIYEVSPKNEAEETLQRNEQPVHYRLLQTLEGPSADIEWLTWHPKGPAIAAGSADCSIWMWWAPTGKLMRVFSGHGGRVTAGCFANNGKVLCTASEDACVIIWSGLTGSILHKFGHPEKVRDMESDERLLPPQTVVCFALHHESVLLATGAINGACKLINTESGRVLSKLHGHNDSIESLSFFDDSQGQLFGPQVTLAAGSLDGIIIVWDCSKMIIRYKFDQNAQQVNPMSDVEGVTRLAWLPNNTAGFLSASTSGNLYVWDCRKGKCKQLIKAHVGAVLDLSPVLFSKNDTVVRVVTVGDDSIGNIWNIDTSDVG